MGGTRGISMPRLKQHLPGSNADVWEWQLQARCRGVDSSVFFHPEGERGRARLRREQRAKEMCRLCPVVAQCRDHALETGEVYGVWGGLSESERGLLINPLLQRDRDELLNILMGGLRGSKQSAELWFKPLN
jgi:WhiB family transcriptional regulator, redox-sensing transcriptional regulator